LDSLGGLSAIFFNFFFLQVLVRFSNTMPFNC